ncbi:hypothetical protein EIN_308660 [Entamoeba invadens IP1]|uniref:Expansin-like EG45 domain-containing protein n=1 Tax=Entamoeba invadens IP1 TaxID=370355 RepID=A0A0A1TZ07_ENTIV|nr:hypothetical protein EIN_308660 [Entamoeba invadens IP1]ELP86760.1 hypothetical protein EIN_308660 [Entamoeba invadens IP1]|eukprot:XP_004186106.1 hypothetical protein EIN_308660 [Entamoeba invadens IP1]
MKLQSLSFIIHLISLVISQSYDVPCLLGMRVETIENIGVSGRVGQYSQLAVNCYDDIPDYKKHVYAMSSQLYCYVSKAIFYQQYQNMSIARCGICIELTGPSMKPFTCAIAGMYTVRPDAFAAHPDLAYDIPRTFFLPKKLVTDIAVVPSEGGASTVVPVN